MSMTHLAKKLKQHLYEYAESIEQAKLIGVGEWPRSDVTVPDGATEGLREYAMEAMLELAKRHKEEWINITVQLLRTNRDNLLHEIQEAITTAKLAAVEIPKGE